MQGRFSFRSQSYPQITQIDAIEAQKSESRQGAAATSLVPGAFTAILAGKNGAIGLGLVEI